MYPSSEHVDKRRATRFGALALVIVLVCIVVVTTVGVNQSSTQSPLGEELHRNVKISELGKSASYTGGIHSLSWKSIVLHKDQEVKKDFTVTTPLTIRSLPSVVQVDLLSFAPSCSGVILSASKVLTAAHCFDSKVAQLVLKGPTIERMRVWGGRVNGLEENGQANSGHSQFRRIVAVTFHPLYETGKGVGHGIDLAVITLKTPFTFNEFVQPVPFFDGGVGKPDNLNALAAGWGPIGHAVESPHLRVGKMVTQNRANVCGSALKREMTKRELCVKRLEGTSCGDIGGPLFISKENKPFLVGVNSYRVPASGCVDAFVRVDYSSSWIFTVNRHEKSPVYVRPDHSCWDHWGCGYADGHCRARALYTCNTPSCPTQAAANFEFVNQPNSGAVKTPSCDSSNNNLELESVPHPNSNGEGAFIAIGGARMVGKGYLILKNTVSGHYFPSPNQDISVAFVGLVVSVRSDQCCVDLVTKSDRANRWWTLWIDTHQTTTKWKFNFQALETNIHHEVQVPQIIRQRFSVAFTFDHSSKLVKFYFNGVLVGQKVAAYGLPMANHPVWVGGSPDGRMNLNGLVLKASMYERVLSQGEIAQIHEGCVQC